MPITEMLAPETVHLDIEYCFDENYTSQHIDRATKLAMEYHPTALSIEPVAARPRGKSIVIVIRVWMNDPINMPDRECHV